WRRSPGEYSSAAPDPFPQGCPVNPTLKTGSPVTVYLVAAAVVVGVLLTLYVSSCVQTRSWEDLDPQERVWRRQFVESVELEEECRQRGDFRGAEAAAAEKRRALATWSEYIKERRQHLK